MNYEEKLSKVDEKIKLRPCPFCGVVPKIYICDDEGNIHDENYLHDSYSGLSFGIEHTIEQKGAENCPIATYEDEKIGVMLFDSVDELAECWNKRIKK